jgi:L-ascorbate 6-phosphate lactonase
MKQRQPVAYWDESFRQQMEAHTIDRGLVLWALSGPSFALRTPQAMIYIDPYLGSEPAEGLTGLCRTTAVPLDPSKIRLADAVLVSHNHYDHCHEATLQAMAKATTAVFYGPTSVVRELHDYGIPMERVVEVKSGDRLQVADTSVTVWPGNDPGEDHAVCFRMEAGSISLFFAGDSLPGAYLDEVAAMGSVDIAMLAFGRTWYMNEGELLQAAARLHPKVLVPYHWDIWLGHTGSPFELGRLVERQKPSFAVELLLIGQGLEYRPDGSRRRLS